MNYRRRAVLFRQLFDAKSSTYTYLVANTRSRHALLIDPVFEQVERDSALLGELGHIERAELVPLGRQAEAMDAWDRSAPMVAVCRSGARSAQAALLLERAGFERVASLGGGMIRWRAMGHPVAHPPSAEGPPKKVH